MPQVPYNPVPTTRPSGQATPQIGISTGNWGVVGQALERLGSTVEASGNELFSRAMAFQQLRNESEANDLAAKHELASGQLFTDYQSSQGQNAADGHMPHNDGQEKLRTEYRDQASNPMVAKMFDQYSRRVMNQNMHAADSHAATQMKVWSDGAASARVDAATHQAGINPADDKAFDEQLNTISDAVQQKAELWGWSPEQYNDEFGKVKSKAWERRVEQLSKTDPFTAGKMLEEHGGELRGDDLSRAQGIVKQQRDTTGARNISTAVGTGKGWDYGAKVVTRDQAREAIAQVESGGDYGNITQSHTRLGRALGKYQVMEGELQEDLKNAGLPLMTPEQFLKDHSAQDKVFDTKFGKDMDKYGSFNEAASRWLSGRSVADGIRTGVADRFGTDVKSYLNKTNAALARGATLTQKTDAGRSLAERDAPQDPSFVDQAITRIETDHNHQMQIERSKTQEDIGTLDAGLRGERSQGKIPSTMEELLADPDSRKAYDALPEKEKLKIPAAIASYNRAVAVRTDQSVMNRAKGMADEDPIKFLGMNFNFVEGLSQKSIGDLQKLQREKRKDMEGNPHVAQAYGLIRSSLPADFDKTDNDDARHQLKGALQEALIYEMGQRGGKLTRDDMLNIGKAVLKEQVTGYNWFGLGTVNTPFYQIPVPEEYASKVRQEYRANKLGEPNEDEIRNHYLRARYIEMQNKKAAK